MSETQVQSQSRGTHGSAPTSLEKLETFMIWGIWHEVDGGVTSVVIGNAQES